MPSKGASTPARPNNDVYKLVVSIQGSRKFIHKGNLDRVQDISNLRKCYILILVHILNDIISCDDLTNVICEALLCR